MKMKKTWNIDFAARLNSENPFKYIEPYLTENDYKKIEINKEIFG